MIAKLRTLLDKTTARYIAVGGTVYVFELVVMLSVQALHGSGLLAVGLSFWLGLFVSFGLQKFVTFGDKRTHTKIVVPQFLAVSALVLSNFAFTLAVTSVLAKWLPAIVTRTIALGVTTIWNFYLYKTKIFTSSDVVPID